jgi:FkbM family methyltransferase
LGVDIVIDVGGNEGQYALELRDHGYAGQIVSIEPLEEAYNTLLERARKDPQWEAVQCAAGAADDHIALHVSANSYSSSILRMLPRHVEAAPGSDIVASVEVRMDRLDSIAASFLSSRSQLYIKIDTQGYERSVLDGASTLLRSCVGLEVEMSLLPLYEGQPLIREMMDYLEGAGFRLAGLTPGFYDKKSGEMLQVDGIFVRG